MSENQEAPTRRVRSWIAALLTFLGWGVGAFYARRTGAAVKLAFAQLLFALALGVGALVLLIQGPADISRYFQPDELSALDALNLGLTLLAAIFVWRLAAQRQEVERGGPVRLLGYLAIWLVPLCVALLLAMSLRFLLWQPFRQPSASMAPTLQVGQMFVVEKWRYGYSRYSFAPLEGLFPEGRWLARAPERGDVVVFRPLQEPSRDYVKRIVGLPGDRVQMIAGVLHINGAAVAREDLGEAQVVGYRGERVETARAIRETLPNGLAFTTFDRGDGELDNTREFTVPAGHYFVMGDNRDVSDDSRRSIGFVPFENIVGRTIVRPTTP